MSSWLRWFVLVLALAWTGQAADLDAARFKALSEFESADRDYARGAAGEVSRYQVLPSVWSTYRAAQDWQCPKAAQAVAERIQADRVRMFLFRFGRPPTDFEWYVLWNAPSLIATPPPSVADRAQRFVQLVRAVIAEAR